MQIKELDSDSQMLGIGREGNKSTDKKTPSEIMKKTDQKKTSKKEVKLLELWSKIWRKGVSFIWQNM